MNLKNIKIISIISIFLLSILFHFLYDLIPNIITSILFPVNESIWEHMKLIFTSTIIFSIIEYLLLNKYNIKHNNYYLSLFFSAVLSFIFYLIIYIPIYNTYGENIFISIFLLFLVIVIFQIFSYYILNLKNNKYLNYLSIVLIILTFIIFIYFTYNPLKNYLFYDIITNNYGILNK